MNTTLQIKTLLHREWMQHRFGWTLMLLLPVCLTALLLPVGNIDLGAPGEGPPAHLLPLVATLSTVMGTAVVLAAIASVASLIFAIGMPRRDHGDRSVEFWLSLPLSHRASLGLPLAVHLLLVPLVAVAFGWLAGHGLSLLVVAKLAQAGSWFTLPWAELLPATLALTLRLMAGLLMATLWLAPLLLLLVLAYALLRMWGLIGLGAVAAVLAALDQVRLLDLVGDWIERVFVGAAQSVISGRGYTFEANDDNKIGAVLSLLPSWAWGDFLGSIANLASPVFLGGLVLAGAWFALLVLWRRRGAGLA